ncbi:RHS repeat-associated core domain-containing protein [Streptomyces sp. NPDC091217]|uniref:RHS repeat-associated core domain-containing protein n=1 Tax=Streptomyces sp. NPDC091217 TaxID=3365975 RepID=UPI00380F22ED
MVEEGAIRERICKAGQAVTETLPGGVKREQTYDGLGRLTGETGTGAEATTTSRSLSYDLAGRLLAVGTADGVTENTYTYNDRGQLLTAAGPGGTAGYTYDADGNMTVRKTKAGTANYGYDSAGRLDWAWDSITNNDIWYDFDAAGRPRLEQYATKPDGATSYAATAKRTYAYDDFGRLKNDTVTTPDGATTIASTGYGYDLDDNLTSKTTAGTAGAGTNTYAYDYANRLITWTKGGTSVSYGWDGAGNRTTAGTTTSTYDARNRQLTDGSTTYTYTARGTLATTTTGTTTRAQTSDAFERKITDGPTTYTYDSLDRIQTRGSTTFAYDGGSNNLAGDGTTTYNRTPNGTLLSLTDGTTKQWAVTDQHTDLTTELAPDGLQVTGSTAYDPFGKKTATNGTTPAVGYQSGYTDPVSGDVNMAARWYQPGTGNFSSRDTWQLDPVTQQANRYTYTPGNPLGGTDPTGHDTKVRDVPCRKTVEYRSNNNWLGRSGGLFNFWSAFRFGTRQGGRGWILAAEVFLNVWGWNSPSYYDGYTAPPLKRDKVRQPKGTSALVRTGPSTSTGPGAGAGTGAGTGSGGGGVIIPPAPPIDQNPNNGSTPDPAPTRTKPKAEYENAGWNVGDGVDTVVGVVRMLELAGNEQYTPDAQAAQGTSPGNDSGTDGGNRNTQDCRRGESGWVDYGALDRTHGNRATTMNSCLDSAYLSANKGSPAVGTLATGYQWAKNTVNDWDYDDDSYWINACHLLSKELTGTGRNSANLSTCTRPANAMVRGDDRIEVNFRHYEKIVRKAISGNKVVQYSVTPNYAGDRVVANSWTFNATAWDKNGKRSVLFSGGVVHNVIDGKNLGRQNDDDGNPVPVR